MWYEFFLGNKNRKNTQQKRLLYTRTLTFLFSVQFSYICSYIFVASFHLWYISLNSTCLVYTFVELQKLYYTFAIHILSFFITTLQNKHLLFEYIVLLNICEVLSRQNLFQNIICKVGQAEIQMRPLRAFKSIFNLCFIIFFTLRNNLMLRLTRKHILIIL